MGVVDYTVGNVGSVLNALEKTGARPKLVRTLKEAEAMDALVLPGVGTYTVAHSMVHQFREVILEKPTLAICLGMQLLFESSEEGGGRGLAIFNGRVERINAERIPHIGWSYTHSTHPLVESGYYYYLHSYGVLWNSLNIHHVAYVELKRRYVAVAYREPIIAVQFHPERSSKMGIALIRKFLKYAKS